ncbi:ricin-type beta-trefoil lectin domain protein [Streptomyces sp. NPDC048521]|uniref:RICIN domain-containing protein n=1 Tax=Streptomyces sp. NPDC048521 TaxID=3365566 RepID=UPI00372222BA
MHEAGPSDEQLSAELKKWNGTTPALHPVGELLDRHWEAAFAYARLCTDGPRAAGMLTTAAFTRLFGESLRQSGPGAAWRPHVLVAVRRIAAEWDTDGRQELLHPALRSGGGTGERATARLLPPPGRRLLSRAFQRVPQISRAVLWHTQVEAEPLSVPAALLDLEEEDVRVELRRGRERLREECLQVHRELAPEAECRSYLRMLDVTFRRGGLDIDPDLRGHLARCPHCSRTADQLAQFDAGLGLALAEAVLGWGARAYAESRASRAETPAEPAPAPAAVAPPAGEAFTEAQAPDGPTDPTHPTGPVGPAASGRSARHAEPPVSRGSARRAEAAGPGRSGRRADSAAPSRSGRRAARRARRRHLALAVVTVSGLVVLPLVLWSVLGSGGTPASGPGGTSSRAPGKDSASPGASWAGASGAGQGALHGRLRNLASGLCVGVVGEEAVEGAETELTGCSAAPSRQWTYETDGLLRNNAAPGLCLDSHLGYSVRLTPCSATGRAARNIRYDFTLQGALVPRWNQELALTPAATDGSGALVLKTRAAGAAQRWSVDTAQPDLEMQNVNWGSDSAPSPAATARSTAPRKTPTPTASRTTPPPAPTPAATRSGPSATPSAPVDFCSAYPYYCGGYGGGGRHHR